MTSEELKRQSEKETALGRVVGAGSAFSVFLDLGCSYLGLCFLTALYTFILCALLREWLTYHSY